MKRALVVVAIVLAVLAGAAYWAYHSLDVIVRVGLEHYAPDVLGVPVKVGGIDLSAADGRGALRGLEIGNPQGFTAKQAVRVGEIRLALDPASVTGPVVRIRELTVDAALITYERGDHGTNLEAIQKNIQRYIQQSGGPSQSRPAEARHGKRKFIVDRLTIQGARVTMTNPALHGQGVTFGLPDIQLHDLGRRQGGLTASEIGDIVAGELQSRIAQRVLTNIELLRKGGIGGALDALKGLLH